MLNLCLIQSIQLIQIVLPFKPIIIHHNSTDAKVTLSLFLGAETRRDLEAAGRFREVQTRVIGRCIFVFLYHPASKLSIRASRAPATAIHDFMSHFRFTS